MNGLEKTCEFLKTAGTYFLATVDGDAPKVRPFGTAHIYEGKLYIQTGLKKEVSRQMLENPKVELSAFNDGVWVRVSAEAVLDEREEAQSSMLEAYPELKSMYAVGDGNTAVFYLTNAKATFYSFASEPEVYEL